MLGKLKESDSDGIPARELKVAKTVSNPFRPDRCLAYNYEFDLYRQEGIWPGFWELGDRIYKSVMSEAGGIWILEEGIREGNTSLGFYLGRGREGARGVVYNPMTHRPKSAVETFAQIVNVSKLSLDRSPTEGREISAQRFRSEMEALAKEGGFVLMMDEFDYLFSSLPEADFRLVIQALSETVFALAGMEGGKLGLLLNTPIYDDKIGKILSENFPEAKIPRVRLPLLTLEDIVKMGRLIPQIPIDETGFRKIYYLTGGHPALTQLLFYSLVNNYNGYERPQYDISMAGKVDAKEILKVGHAITTNVDGWNLFHPFWTRLTMEERGEIFRLALRLPILDVEELESHINPNTLDRILSDEDKRDIKRLEHRVGRLHHLNFGTIKRKEREILEGLVLKGLAHRGQEDGVYIFGPAILLLLALRRRAP